MVSFSNNLIRYSEQIGESYQAICQLADLTQDELTNLELEVAPKNTLYKFCANLEIDIRSIYSDDGFVAKPLIDQYSDYPTLLKRIISRLFCRQLIKSYCENSETQFKIFLKVTKIGSQVISRIISGNSCFSPADFNEVFAGMSHILSRTECKLLLAKCMYSLIPNWNFMQLHKYYNMSYSKIAAPLKLSGSAISNWGSIGAVPMPESYFEPIANILGGFTKQEFSTRFIELSECKDKQANLTASIDPVDDLSDLSILDVDSNKENEPAKSPAKKKKTKRSKTKPVKQRKPKSRQDAPSDEVETEASTNNEPNSSHINITEETIQKMYNKLNPNHKAEVVALISNLFFSEL